MDWSFHFYLQGRIAWMSKNTSYLIPGDWYISKLGSGAVHWRFSNAMLKAFKSILSFNKLVDGWNMNFKLQSCYRKAQRISGLKSRLYWGINVRVGYIRFRFIYMGWTYNARETKRKRKYSLSTLIIGHARSRMKISLIPAAYATLGRKSEQYHLVYWQRLEEDKHKSILVSSNSCGRMKTIYQRSEYSQ